jgi:hypothetical protein
MATTFFGLLYDVMVVEEVVSRQGVQTQGIEMGPAQLGGALSGQVALNGQG